MKNILFLMLLSTFADTAIAQQITLTGQVSTHNSRYRTGQIEYIKDAYATAPFAAPGSTNATGIFRLVFVNVDGGASVKVDVEKIGMEIVNKRDLLDVVIGRKGTLKVFLAPKGYLAKAQAELFEVNMKVLTARHEALIADLRRGGAAREAVLADLRQNLEHEFNNWYEAEQLLDKKLKAVKERLPETVKQLTAMNLDFASELYIAAYRLYEQGQAEKAIALLDASRLDKDAAEAGANLDMIDNDLEQYQSAREQAQERVRQIVRSYQLKSEAYTLLFKYRQAAEVYAKAIALLEKTKKGVEDMELAGAYQDFGRIYRHLGAYEKSRSYYQKNLDICEGLLDPDAPELAMAQSFLGHVLRELGDSQGAKELLKKAFYSFDKNFGLDHPLSILNYASLISIEEHDWVEYEAFKYILQMTLKSIENKKGIDDSAIALSYSSLAAVLLDKGDYTQAKVLMDKVVAANEKTYGNDHPYTTASYSRLAYILLSKGDYSNAKALFEKAIAANKKILGTDHPTTWENNIGLATVLQAMGDFSNAKILFEEVVTVSEKTLGDTHPITIASYVCLASVLQDMGDYPSTKALYEKLIPVYERTLGPDHLHTTESYSGLASVFQAMGDLHNAKTLFEKVVEINKKKLGHYHKSTALSYFKLASVLQAMGDLPNAKTLFEKTAMANEMNFGFYHIYTVGSNYKLATILRDLGDLPNAKALFEKVVAANENNFGPDHPNTASSYLGLASVLFVMEDLPNAKMLYEKAVAINERKLGLGHIATTESYAGLASVLQTKGDYANAITLLKKALENANQSAIVYYGLYNRIGLCHYNLKDYSQALANYEKGYQLDKKNYRQPYLNNTGMAYAKAGNFPEAKSRFELLQSLIPNNGLPYRDWAVYYALSDEPQKALDNLEKAIQLGYDNLQWIISEDSFAPLREEERYHVIITQLQNKK
jgi:tetratricopeptide (TPR) repeat protein